MTPTKCSMIDVRHVRFIRLLGVLRDVAVSSPSPSLAASKSSWSFTD